MRHRIEPHRVDLKSKSMSGLRDSSTGLEFMGKRLQIRNHLGVDLRNEPSNDASEQHATKARSRLTREATRAKRDPPSWRVRARAEDLKFGQRTHGARVSPYLLEDPVGRGEGSIVCPHD